MFIIDDTTWNVNMGKHTIRSIATIEEKEETSGKTIGGNFRTDYEGTSLVYEIPIDTRNLSQTDRNSFYAVLTESADHTITVPINGEFIKRKAKIIAVTRADYCDGNGNIIYSAIESITVRLQNYWRKPE